jgi:hypothetical protein
VTVGLTQCRWVLLVHSHQFDLYSLLNHPIRILGAVRDNRVEKKDGSGLLVSSFHERKQQELQQRQQEAQSSIDLPSDQRNLVFAGNYKIVGTLREKQIPA